MLQYQNKQNITDFNKIIGKKYRLKLNSQKNMLKLEQVINKDGIIAQPYRYVLGLGERHFRSFENEIEKITTLYPWTKKKHLRFILNELILNSQFSMLREVVKKIKYGKKVAGYFFITIYINDNFVTTGIEEFGDFFDYYSYIKSDENFNFILNSSDYYDEVSELHVKSLNDLSDDNLKLILTKNNELIIPDDSNKIGLNVIENATDHDFYITSFYKNGIYMWKRIYFRLENDCQ